MSEFGRVNSANVADISLVDFPPAGGRDPIALITRARVFLPGAPDPESPIDLTENPQPQWELYLLARSTEQPPGPASYYSITTSYAFRNAANTGPGTVGDPTSIVQESRVYNEIPIADLYAQKQREVRNQDQSVRYNAVDTSLSGPWWLIVTQDARFELDGIQGNWLRRLIDGLNFPSGPNAPWVGIFNANNQNSRRTQVTDAATWDTLYLEKTEHDQATGNATDASVSALDLAYDDGLGDWAAVADHDPADPAWGYPPTVTLQL